MASTVFADITGALSGHLQTMAGLPPVALENKTYTPTAGTLYLTEATIPGETIQAGAGASGIDYTVGVYQVTVYAPSDKGKGAAYAMADKIADHFKRGTYATRNAVTVQVTSVSVAAPLVESAWYALPVSIFYQTYTAAR